MEQNLKRLEEQEQKYSAELNVALNEYAVLRERAQGVDPVQLYVARQTIRPKMEQDVMCHLQKIYGERYSHIMMERSKRSVALRLHEADEQGCYQKTTLQRSNKQAHHDEGERLNYSQYFAMKLAQQVVLCYSLCYNIICVSVKSNKEI